MCGPRMISWDRIRDYTGIITGCLSLLFLSPPWQLIDLMHLFDTHHRRLRNGSRSLTSFSLSGLAWHYYVTELPLGYIYILQPVQPQQQQHRFGRWSTLCNRVPQMGAITVEYHIITSQTRNQCNYHFLIVTFRLGCVRKSMPRRRHEQARAVELTGAVWWWFVGDCFVTCLLAFLCNWPTNSS